MDMVKFKARHQWVREELERCVNFWLKNGMDEKHGGVYILITKKQLLFKLPQFPKNTVMQAFGLIIRSLTTPRKK